MSRKRTNSTLPVAKAGERSYEHHMFTPDQLRAARALKNWSQEDLASAAGVALMVIKNFERSLSDPRLSSMKKLKTALEKADVIFVDEAEGRGAGVCWAGTRCAE